jgi:hypothetical protein
MGGLPGVGINRTRNTAYSILNVFSTTWYFFPIFSATPIELRQITMNGAAGFGPTVRIALYNCDAKGQPTSPIADFGALGLSPGTPGSVNPGAGVARFTGFALLAFVSSASGNFAAYDGIPPGGAIFNPTQPFQSVGCVLRDQGGGSTGAAAPNPGSKWDYANVTADQDGMMYPFYCKWNNV